MSIEHSLSSPIEMACEWLIRLRRSRYKEDLSFLEESFQKAQEVSECVVAGADLAEVNALFEEWDFSHFLLKAELALDQDTGKHLAREYGKLTGTAAALRHRLGGTDTAPLPHDHATLGQAVGMIFKKIGGYRRAAYHASDILNFKVGNCAARAKFTATLLKELFPRLIICPQGLKMSDRQNHFVLMVALPHEPNVFYEVNPPYDFKEADYIPGTPLPIEYAFLINYLEKVFAETEIPFDDYFLKLPLGVTYGGTDSALFQYGTGGGTGKPDPAECEGMRNLVTTAMAADPHRIEFEGRVHRVDRPGFDAFERFFERLANQPYYMRKLLREAEAYAPALMLLGSMATMGTCMAKYEPASFSSEIILVQRERHARFLPYLQASDLQVDLITIDSNDNQGEGKPWQGVDDEQEKNQKEQPGTPRGRDEKDEKGEKNPRHDLSWQKIIEVFCMSGGEVDLEYPMRGGEEGRKFLVQGVEVVSTWNPLPHAVRRGVPLVSFPSNYGCPVEFQGGKLIGHLPDAVRFVLKAEPWEDTSLEAVVRVKPVKGGVNFQAESREEWTEGEEHSRDLQRASMSASCDRWSAYAVGEGEESYQVVSWAGSMPDGFHGHDHLQTLLAGGFQALEAAGYSTYFYCENDRWWNLDHPNRNLADPF